MIAASNRKLGNLVQTGKFRTVRNYRLNVIPITVPLLRERRQKIGPLANHFIEAFLTDAPGKITGLTRTLMKRLEEYAWPGNMRELRNFIEYGVHFRPPGPLILEHLAHRFETPAPVSGGIELETVCCTDRPQNELQKLYHARKSVELDPVIRALEVHGYTVRGKKSAARQLGISLSTLYRILRTGA